MYRYHTQVEFSDKYKTIIHAFQHKREALEGCNLRFSFVTERTTNQKNEEGQAWHPSFLCIHVYCD